MVIILKEDITLMVNGLGGEGIIRHGYCDSLKKT